MIHQGLQYVAVTEFVTYIPVYTRPTPAKISQPMSLDRNEKVSGMNFNRRHYNSFSERVEYLKFHKHASQKPCGPNPFKPKAGHTGQEDIHVS
jgi:hypothetical protein